MDLAISFGISDVAYDFELIRWTVSYFFWVVVKIILSSQIQAPITKGFGPQTVESHSLNQYFETVIPEHANNGSCQLPPSKIWKGALFPQEKHPIQLDSSQLSTTHLEELLCYLLLVIFQHYSLLSLHYLEYQTTFKRSGHRIWRLKHFYPSFAFCFTSTNRLS